MDNDGTELAQLMGEQDTAQKEATLNETENASEADSDTSPDGAELAADAEKKPASKGEEPEEETEPGKETYEQKVTSLAQKIADKAAQTITKQRDEALTRVTQLEEQLNERVWDRHLQSLFNEDTEKLGEDEANTRKKDRELVAQQVADFRKKDAQVKAIISKIGDTNIEGVLQDLKASTLKEAVSNAGFLVRDQRAFEEVLMLQHPELKQMVAEIKALVKTKFGKTQDWDEYDIVMGGLRETAKAARKPKVPDSSHSGGGGGKKAGSPIDRIVAELKKENK